MALRESRLARMLEDKWKEGSSYPSWPNPNDGWSRSIGLDPSKAEHRSHDGREAPHEDDIP